MSRKLLLPVDPTLSGMKKFCSCLSKYTLATMVAIYLCSSCILLAEQLKHWVICRYIEVVNVFYLYSAFAPDCEDDSLQKMASQLQFNLFDEVVVNVTRVSNLHQ